MKVKEKIKRDKNCEGCALLYLIYCRECCNFSLCPPKVKLLESF